MRWKEKKIFFEIFGVKMKIFLKNNFGKFVLRMDKREGKCYVLCIDIIDRCESVFDIFFLLICVYVNERVGFIISVCLFDR